MKKSLNQPLPPEQEHSDGPNQQFDHLLPQFSSSFPSFLSRPHPADHEQHSGDAADDGDFGDFEKSDWKQQPVRGGTPVHLSARVSGAVHTGEAHPLSAAHAGHFVAGIRALPHQAEVCTLCKGSKPEKT